MKVSNAGFQTVTLQNLTIAALQTPPVGQSSLVPVGNLQFDGSFSPIEISPNGETPGTLIFSRELSLGKALDLLSDSGSLVLQASAWQTRDAEGRSYTHNLTNILSKDALVTIDYGPRIEQESGRAKESYYVSTVGDFDTKSITVGDALERILRIPFSSGSTNWGVSGEVEATFDGLLRVRGVDTVPGARGRWVVVLGSLSDSGASEMVEVFDNLEGAYDFEALELRKGSSLLLTYVEDADNDGVFSREEFVNGTSDQDPDSDDDGLTDFIEIRESWLLPVTTGLSRRIFTDPLYSDLEEDGLLDSEERSRRTDPRNPDTDGDGIRDAVDTVLIDEDMYEIAHFEFDGNLSVRAGGPASAAMAGAEFRRDRFDDPNSALYLNGLWRTQGSAPDTLPASPPGLFS